MATGIRIRRRDFLKVAGFSGAALWLPWLPGCGTTSSGGASAAHPVFFTDAERATMRALAAAIVPDDDTVGAVEAGAVDYLDRWLAAFDGPRPDVFRGGPFSGREPWPDPATGAAGRDFPDDDFVTVLPLTRLQELAVRIELYGSDAVPGGDVNAGLVPQTRGLRAIHRDGVAELERRALERGATGFAELGEAARLEVFAATPAEFQQAVLGELAEGLFCAPEYGGNRGARAWRDYYWDGDSQPLGHTLFDPATGAPYDRADRPNQSRDPALPDGGFDLEVERFVEAVVLGQGGKRFF